MFSDPSRDTQCCIVGGLISGRKALLFYRIIPRVKSDERAVRPLAGRHSPAAPLDQLISPALATLQRLKMHRVGMRGTLIEYQAPIGGFKERL